MRSGCPGIVVRERFVPGADHEAAAVGHDVPGVHRKIDQGELQLRRVDLDWPQRRIQVDDQSHGLAERTPQHVGHGVEALAQIDSLGRQGLAAREAQQLAGQACAPPRGRQDRIQGLVVAVLDKTAVEQFGLAADDHQKVVEIVGDAAGQLAQGFQLLGLDELFACAVQSFLGAEPLGDVACDLGEARQSALVVADRIDDDARPE